MKAVNLCESFTWKFFASCLRSAGITNGPVHGLSTSHHNFPLYFLFFFFTFSPVFSHGVKTPQRLNYGQNGTIQLELSAYPPLKYHWTKDREELTLPTDGKVMDPYSGSIRITRVGRDDAGMYTCRAVWKEGRPMETEDSVEIEVFVVGEFFKQRILCFCSLINPTNIF